MANRLPLSATLLALLLTLPVAPGRGQGTPVAPAPAGGTSAGPGAEPAGSGLSGKELEVLERIRQLKTPRWREFGVCRYDWGGWKASEAGVRVTAVECGDPPLKATVAVHCDTLRLNRRPEDGTWETWRLPLSVAESRTTGGEDRMVAALCANVQPSAPASRGTRPTTPPALSTPSGGTPAKPAAATPSKPKPK